jgi:hypothetical protein
LIVNQFFVIDNRSKKLNTATLNILKDSAFDDSAHDFYKQWFNLIDVADKKWYAAADSHLNRMWKSKMLFNDMRHFMLNAWILNLSQKFTKYMDFREDLASDLVSFLDS